MTAKQYLQRYRELEGRYNTTLEEYKNLEADMITLKSPDLSGDRVQTSPKNDPIGEMVCQIEARKGIIGVRMLEFSNQMYLIRNQIHDIGEINSDYGSILVLRYILYKDWRFICDKLFMSRAQANIVHNKALQEFDKQFKDSYAEK